jgi:hypothetical protein
MANLVDATTGKIDDPTFTVGPGFATLLNTPLNQAIADATNIAGSSRQAMSFFLHNSNLTLSFSLNPQNVQRKKNVVESEFPTMNAWHTYRWMEEPTLWMISGYAGLLGPKMLDYIQALDGQDDVLWSYSYVGVVGQSVKIISTLMPWDSSKGPFSTYYQITMRENNNVVLNTSSDGYGVQRLAEVFTNLTYNIPTQLSTAGTYNVGDGNATSLSAVAQYLLSKKLTTVDVSTQITYMKTVNHLKTVDWPGQQYPIDDSNQELHQLYFNTGQTG